MLCGARSICMLYILVAGWCTTISAASPCDYYTGNEACSPAEPTPWIFHAFAPGGSATNQTSAAAAMAIMNESFIKFWSAKRCTTINPPSNISEFTINSNGRKQWATAGFTLNCPNWTTPEYGNADIGALRDHTCPSGLRLYSITNYHEVVCLGSNSSLEILSPLEQEQFELTEEELTRTSNIAFQANPGSQNGSASVSWSTTLEYQTSGGRSAYSETENFITIGTAADDRHYTSIGGRLTINASAMLNGVQRTAGPRLIYITGVQIPDDVITARLISLYSGATQNILTGIAMKESDYIQFSTRTLYSVSAKWPNESYDGGSHVGLMQVPTSKAHAWDWKINTQSAADLLSEKLQIVSNRERTFRARYPGLRGLTNIERENMALLLYGPESSNNLSRQYYIPIRAPQNSWEWAVNTAGNASGIAYADSVRNQIQ